MSGEVDAEVAGKPGQAVGLALSDRAESPGPAPYTVFDVSERLRTEGWQVPAYTMPEAATDEAIMRVVIREGFSFDRADSLLAALRSATDYLTANPPRTSTASLASATPDSHAW
jgi:glutamate/tyrosine decarboxylase-like PLP-dependent enzyme